MRPLALALAAVFALAGPAQAAGVGFSLPKFRALTVDTSTSFGGSVQVVGTNFSIQPVKVGVALDYAFTRDFAAGANHAFFDVTLGAGVPFGLTPQFYLEPAVDTHTLLVVASPLNLASPAFGVGPRLTAGYRPSASLSIQLSASHALMLGMQAGGRAVSGGLTTVELGGTYSF